MKRVLVVMVAVLWAGLVGAQGVTTGAISGVVVDQSGAPVPGASVTAVLTTMGTRYVGVTDGDGRFNFPNVRAGGPYRITAQLGGFRDGELVDVYVNLGEQTTVNVLMPLESFTEEIAVLAESNPLINPAKVGAASNVRQEALESLPTVERSIQDFARTNPYMAVIPDGSEAATITVAGRNNRYNNIQIDGAVNNDLFGLASTGTPGGQTETQPISLDALQELHLVIAPFDVRQGGFSGGGLNAITRSGSNQLRGSAYGYMFDDSLVGEGPDAFPELGTFEEEQYGFRIGGPILQDKAFFFVNAEMSELNRPTGWSISGDAGSQFMDGDALAEAQQFRDILINQYGFDPGGLDQQTRDTASDKVFLRTDFNLSPRNNLTVRHNYVDAENLILRPDDFAYEFPSHAYLMQSETNSTVAQLNSVIGDDKFNELRVTYQKIEDRRGAPPGYDPFPYVRIDRVAGSSRDFEAGIEQYSTFNSLDQEILEITDDFTFFVGDHEIVLGTHNELFSFDNLFIQQGYGAYRFRTIADFEAGNAYQFDYTYSADETPSDAFDVSQLGFYAGDNWKVRPNFTLVYGLRVDVPLFPDEPKYNELAEDVYGVRTDEVPDGNAMWSPRVGFNWDIGGEAKRQLRGGIGLFSGRTPYVWISNNYGRTGIEQVTINAFSGSNGIEFVPDPFNQPTDIGGASTQEINIVDPDFDFPQVWRYNLGYDHRLPWWDLVATVEALYTEVESDILYQNLNLVQAGTAFDGRPFYEEVSETFSGAYYLSNTNKGENTNVTVKLERPYRNGLWGYLAYTYGDAEVVYEGTSSRAISNWQYTEAVDVNNPGLSTSDFEVEHRFSASLSYQFNRTSQWATTVSGFWNHQAGRPYTLIYTYDSRVYPLSINGDNFWNNDLIYVPASEDEIILQGGTWAQLQEFLAETGYDQYAGQIAPRNAAKAPWTSTVDLHIGQQIPVGYGHLELTADILNFGNLIDEDAGHVRYVDFGTLTPIQFNGYDEATGKPIYELERVVTDPDEEKFELDNLRSRWRAKIGLRYSF